ncbi:MAG: TIGR03936 family radical SAM-associated protein [Synergistaceae bacterium]|nr:TIGR03936 family radical SAM-associated protein [Synergistaceae bacterium]MBR1603336.1 TIGR03936 family radical SAM-associated protein [Synergistaceae bacterium]
MRVRLVYEKRGGACFVPHVSLAQVFIRSAFRINLNFEMTQGFSPRPKMSFGPELPAGVVALDEPVDIYLQDGQAIDIDSWNAAMPEGFRILDYKIIEPDAPALGKACKNALYWLRGNFELDDLADYLKLYFKAEVLNLNIKLDDVNNEWLELLLNAPAQNGIGGFVKSLINDKFIAGWQDINIVRVKLINCGVI